MEKYGRRIDLAHKQVGEKPPHLRCSALKASA